MKNEDCLSLMVLFLIVDGERALVKNANQRLTGESSSAQLFDFVCLICGRKGDKDGGFQQLRVKPWL